MWICFTATLVCFSLVLGNVYKSKPLLYKIKTTWDDRKINHDPVSLELTAHTDGIHLTVNAPFFNDPPNPGGKPGQPFPKLWEYEVVEAFFLNGKNHYLEVEVCPHGQHLVLFLKGYRDSFKDQLPLNYRAVIKGSTWTGKAIIPWEYFPPQVTKFNAYAIHGSSKKRTYEALYPCPKDSFPEPDFHRLSYFKKIDFKAFSPSHWDKPASKYWKRI